MAKRDTDTEIWNEDWFLNLSGSEMLFWFWIKDKCDHAGFWRPNFKPFEISTGHRINQKEFLEKVNTQHMRIEVIENGKWFLTGFIKFHHCGFLNLNSGFHRSIYKIFRENIKSTNTSAYGFEVSETPQRGLKERKTYNVKYLNSQGKEKGAEKEKDDSSAGVPTGAESDGDGRPSSPPAPLKAPAIKNQAKVIPPQLEWVENFCFERKIYINPQTLFDHYEANGWVQGKNKPIKNWQAAVRTWQNRATPEDLKKERMRRDAITRKQEEKAKPPPEPVEFLSPEETARLSEEFQAIALKIGRPIPT
jgi:hypothetical protein